MKIKQTKLIFAALLFSFATAIGFVSFGPANVAYAYKCQGGDYYDADKQECWSFKDVTNRITVTDAAGKQTVVKTCKSDAQVDHQDADGTCWAKGGEKKNYAPSYDDGTTVAGDITCLPYGIQGAGMVKTKFDANEYTCKVDCSLTDLAKATAALGPAGQALCATGKVAPQIPKSDPTSSCLPAGGMYEHNGNASKCTYTEDSCKAKGKKLTANSKGCEDLNECDKKFGANSKSQEYKACTDALNNPNQDCSKKATQILRNACEAGQAAAPESFENCGEAETVLIKCEKNAKGATAIASVLKLIINVLTVLIGIAAVGGIAWAAILYAKAEDNQSNVSEARTLIRNIVIGILLYGFLIAIVNWLVPGGIIG